MGQRSGIGNLPVETSELTLNSFNSAVNSSFNHDPGTRIKITSTSAESPPIPPPSRERSRPRRHIIPPKPMSNGLPPTAKVHMGACFSKVFNGYPLHELLHPGSTLLRGINTS